MFFSFITSDFKCADCGEVLDAKGETSCTNPS